MQLTVCIDVVYNPCLQSESIHTLNGTVSASFTRGLWSIRARERDKPFDWEGVAASGYFYLGAAGVRLGTWVVESCLQMEECQV